MAQDVLLLGTGVFLRGFAADFLQAAHDAGNWAGRAWVVKSTGPPEGEPTPTPLPPYLLRKRGLADGIPAQELTLISCRTGQIHASTGWPWLLDKAASPGLAAIISNTTEAGLLPQPGSLAQYLQTPGGPPPPDYPGKLAALLHARWLALGAQAPQLAILPCELVAGNGDTLATHVSAQARDAALPEAFLAWLTVYVRFCNTLVDRIVTGPAPADEQLTLLTNHPNATEVLDAELYASWIIEGHSSLTSTMPWLAHPAIQIVEEIAPYQERKLRLLNGTHSFMAPYGLVQGLETVGQMMAHPTLGPWAWAICLEEIAPTVPGNPTETQAFAHAVLQRFASPYLHHKLAGICLQATAKMASRNGATLSRWHAMHPATLPQRMAEGLAALIRLRDPAGPWAPTIKDDAAPAWQALYERGLTGSALAHAALTSPNLWGQSWRADDALIEAVGAALERL